MIHEIHEGRLYWSFTFARKDKIAYFNLFLILFFHSKPLLIINLSKIPGPSDDIHRISTRGIMNFVQRIGSSSYLPAKINQHMIWPILVYDLANTGRWFRQNGYTIRPIPTKVHFWADLGRPQVWGRNRKF